MLGIFSKNRCKFNIKISPLKYPRYTGIKKTISALKSKPSFGVLPRKKGGLKYFSAEILEAKWGLLAISALKSEPSVRPVP